MLMAKRLTSFSRLLITLIIVGGIGYGIWYFLNKTAAGRQLTEEAKKEAKVKPEDINLKRIIRGDNSSQ